MAFSFTSPYDPSGKPAYWSMGGGWQNPYTNASVNAPVNPYTGQAYKWQGGQDGTSGPDYYDSSGIGLHTPRISATPFSTSYGGGGGGTGAFGTPSAGTGTSSGVNPLTGLPNSGNNVNNGQVQSPFQTISNPRSQPINATNQALLGNLNSIISNPAVSDYTTAFTGTAPQAAANTAQDIGIVQGIQNGSDMAANIARSNDQFRARTNAVQAALDQDKATILGTNAARMAAGGGTASSYFDRENLANTARVSVPAYLANLEQNQNEINNYTLSNKAQQLAQIGRATAIKDAEIQRLLNPLQVAQQVQGANSSLLQPVSNVDLGQNFYGVLSQYNSPYGGGFSVPNYGTSPYPGATPGVLPSKNPSLGSDVYGQSPTAPPGVPQAQWDATWAQHLRDVKNSKYDFNSQNNPVDYGQPVPSGGLADTEFLNQYGL